MKRGCAFTASARTIGDADFPADLRRLDVEVVEHLDVIAEEADGAEDGRVESVRRARARR